MHEVITEARGAKAPQALPSTLPGIGLRLIGLALVDAFALWMLSRLLRDGVWPLATMLFLVTAAVNVINLSGRLVPLRWISPALTIIALLILYPILFTVYTAFTNYSDGHLLTKIQSIHRIGQDTYLPEGTSSYRWTAYQSQTGEIVLWLIASDGKSYLARPGGPLVEAAPGESGAGPADSDGFPATLEGYRRMARREIIPILDSQLAALEFGEPPLTLRIRSLNEVTQLQQRYVYDGSRDQIVDSLTGIVYRADDRTGFFVAEDGSHLVPGYQVTVGWANFARLFRSPALRGPFVQVFAWTVAFAFLSVGTTFAAGLLMALVMNDRILPLRKVFRSLLILPYAIPGVLGVLIWRGMLNQHFGVITTNLADILGWAPPWFTDPWWSKIGIVLVNLWLGYPYMMLICSGALQAIPADIYEAAEVDGANWWQRFSGITLPLLLVSVGPLLVASFTFNFNNFTVIYAFNEGRPPIPGTPTPAGFTDILITYTFRLAFEGGRGSEYGFAAAITMVIFLVVATITLLQYGFTKRWEEVSESV